MNSNFRWELGESVRDLKSDRGVNRWLCADEESNNKQIKSKKAAAAFIEVSLCRRISISGKSPGRNQVTAPYGSQLLPRLRQ